MHPIMARADRAWIAYLAMGGAGVLIGTRPLLAAGAPGHEAAWFSVWGLALMWMTLGLWPVSRHVRIARAPFGRFLAMTVSLAAGAGAAWMGLGFVAARLLDGPLPSVIGAFQDAWPLFWLVGTMSALTMLFLLHALDAADEGEAAAKRAFESDVASRDAELRALRAQVDPHFLFNCLHSISAMTSREPATARRMCLELADFFRASLRAGAEPRIPLASELQLLRGYLNIEQVRFGDRLRVHVDEAGETGGMLVPPLLLQPLVENAVRHGIATLVEGGEVRVTVRKAADRVEITVENPFDAEGRRPGTGVGLVNVRGRLETAYRGAAMIRADTAPGDPSRFTVLVSIPGEDVRA